MATILRCPKYWLKKWWREWLQGSEPTLRTKEEAWKCSSRYLAKDMFQLSMLIGTSGVAYKRFIASISKYRYSCFIKLWIHRIICLNTVECKIKHTLLSIQIKFIPNQIFYCRKWIVFCPFSTYFVKKKFKTHGNFNTNVNLSTFPAPVPHHQGLLSPRDTVREFPQGDINSSRAVDDSSDVVQHWNVTGGRGTGVRLTGVRLPGKQSN